MEKLRLILICVLALAVSLIVSAYISALSFAFYVGFNPDHVLPWSNLYYIKIADDTGKLVMLAGFSVPLLMAAYLIILNMIKPPFLESRWSKFSDLKNAGLFKKSGLVLGKFKGHYLINDDPTHVLVIAPPRSGKGVGIVVPNLLSWDGSVICLDIKQENYKKSAGARKKYGQEVYMWAPMADNMKSHRYNPLDMVSRDPYQRISDIQMIANILIATPPKSDPVWTNEGRDLFLGLALYVIDNPDMPSTIGAILRLLGTESDLGDVLKHIVKTQACLDPTAKATLMNFANKASKEKSGVKSSVSQALNLWRNPVIDAATSSSDFRFSDLRKKRISIYIGVLTGQLTTLSPLLRIFFEQAITTLSLHEPDPEIEPHKVLMVLDEFHMMGEIKTMASAFTLLGGYNVRMIVVVQALSWIDEVYGRNVREGILSACSHQIFFANNDEATTGYVIKAAGEHTIQTASESKSRIRGKMSKRTNLSDRTAPLLPISQFHNLSRKKQIMIVENSHPVKADKIVYHKDPAFKCRQFPAPSIPELHVKINSVPIYNIPKVQSHKDQDTDDDTDQTDMFDEEITEIHNFDEHEICNFNVKN